MTFVWPLRPNWRSEYSVTYTYLTEILTSEAGREQRRSLRQTPRKTVSFLVTAHQDRFRAIRRLLTQRQGELILLPEVTRSVHVDAGAAPGANAFALAAPPGWMQTGAKVIAVDGDRVAELTFNHASGGAVVFNEALADAWPATTKLCPGLYGRLANTIQAPQPVSGLAEASIVFNVAPGTEPRRFTIADEVWNGREVLTPRADWKAGQTVGHARQVNVVDYGAGPTAAFLPVAFGTETRTADFVCGSREEADQLLAYFERAQGRRGEFYAPTPNPDMVLAEPADQGQTYILVTGEGVADYAADPVYAAISLLLWNRQRIHCSVVQVTSEGALTRLTLGQGLPADISPYTVLAISWLPVNRFASDEITFAWTTDELSAVRFNLQTLEALPPE